jgi:tRNA threonylcarbamoyladenosine biosynthesis protein TsaE
MVEVKKIITDSYQGTIKVGQAFGKTLKNGSIVAFFGDLGSGKTTFIKGIVKGLDINKKINVNSPTFIYLNIYNVKCPIYHFDLYRIKNKNHFFAMGFEEYFLSDGICLIEWAENIKDILPPNTTIIKMKHLSKNKRSILILKQSH